MRTKTLLIQSLFYLVLPLFIFCIGFLQWYFALILIAATLWASRDICHLYVSQDDNWRFGRWQMIAVTIVSLVCCFLLGIGGYWSQSYDWFVKNTLLNELTLSKWPLIIDFSNSTEEVKSICGSDSVGFVYYLFFYLPAALVGKGCCSTEISRFVLFLWTVYGMSLILIWIFRVLPQKVMKNKRLFFLVLSLFVCWGGMDILGQILRIICFVIQGVSPINPNSLIDEWCKPYFTYYASHITSLFWCFNQCIPLWLIMMLIIFYRDVRSVIFFFCFSILYSPWSLIGLFPIVGFFLLRNLYIKRFNAIISIFSFSNIIYPLLLAVVVGLYYMSNSTPLAEKGFFWNYIGIFEFICKYMIFMLLEIGVYVWFLRYWIKSNILLAVSICLLLLIPFYKMTYANDFIMRVSIPALFVLFVSWVKWCVWHFETHRTIVLFVLFLSSFTTIQLFHNTTKATLLNCGPVTYGESSLFSTEDNSFFARTCEEQFYSHEYKTSFFWKYLAKSHE